MPLPLILGAAALAASAYGAKKGYDGYQKHSEADEIVKSSKHRYDRKKSSFDEQEKTTSLILGMLGEKELEIGKSLGEFKTLADALLLQLNADSQKKLEIKIPKHELQRIEKYSFTAIGVLSSIAGAGAAGTAAGFAIYGGVMTLGAASTGTAISSLAGAAATKATLAAIGGGSLATGGLGIAGGTAILSGAVVAPVLAIAGWSYDKHGEKSLNNANKIKNEVEVAVDKLGRAIEQLEKTETYARWIKHSLLSIYEQFNQYFDSLKDIDTFLQDIKGRNADIDKELAKFNEEILRVIENGYSIAAILVEIITTPIFKIRKDGQDIAKDENGVVIMETDSDGSMILNDTELDKALVTANAKADALKAV